VTAVALLAGWPVLLGLTGIPAALQLLLLPFFPESPRYLLIQKGDEQAARDGKVHPCRWWLPPCPRQLQADALSPSCPQPCRSCVAGTTWTLFQLRTLRWQLISIIVLMGGQQLSGVNAVWGWPRGSGADGTVQAAAPRGPAVHTPPSP
jgi:hypothetical protein